MNEPQSPNEPLPMDREPQDEPELSADEQAIDTPKDEVDEASDDSFPASDPPSFTRATD
jgi:hypothetical protein